MKKLLIAAFALLAATAVYAQEQTANAPLVIKAQGSFLAGGTVVKVDGTYYFLPRRTMCCLLTCCRNGWKRNCIVSVNAVIHSRSPRT